MNQQLGGVMNHMANSEEFYSSCATEIWKKVRNLIFMRL